MKLQLLLIAFVCLSTRAENGKALIFEEVYGLIRTNLPDVNPAELSQRAAAGLIKELGTRVQLVTTNESAAIPSGEVIGRRTIYDGAFAYISLKLINDQLASEFRSAVEELSATNDLKGLVIDLRYAQGQDYDAAAAVADAFVKPGEPLLRYGDREVRSTKPAIRIPSAVLVNAETRGAAEAVAAVVKEKGSGLVIGSQTAGEARLFETFTLSTGHQLRVGKIPVEVGDGKLIPATGITPDITVAVSVEDEKILYRDPYSRVARALSGDAAEASAGTNRLRRFNEAELVRRHRGGIVPPPDEEPGDLEEQGIVMDPALARALDFLKGISVLQQQRPL